MLAWDPRTDTWYGPLTAGSEFGLSTGTGVVLAGTTVNSQTCDISFVAPDDFIAAARKADRVYTSEEYRRRQQKMIDALSRLEQAKVVFARRQFDQSAKLLTEVIKTSPNSVEAILLLGLLNDRNCTNRPNEVLKYYRRLADLPNDRRAAFTGLYRTVNLVGPDKRWRETQVVIDEISRRFPKMDESARNNINWWRNECSRELAAKKPAGGR